MTYHNHKESGESRKRPRHDVDRCCVCLEAFDGVYDDATKETYDRHAPELSGEPTTQRTQMQCRRSILLPLEDEDPAL